MTYNDSKVIPQGVINMAVGDSKTRVNLTIDKGLKETITQLAKLDERSVNSLMVLLMKEGLQQPKWQERMKQMHNE